MAKSLNNGKIAQPVSKATNRVAKDETTRGDANKAISGQRNGNAKITPQADPKLPSCYSDRC